MTNPFKYGDVVTGENFCNREQEKKNLKQAIKSGQNTLLFSERRMGKTSLIKQVMEEISSGSVSSVYIDLWPTDDRVTFARALGQGVANHLTAPLEKTLRTLKAWFQSFRVVSSVTQEGEVSFSFDFQGNPEQLKLAEILEIPQKLADKTGQPVVVIFDEIQEISGYDTDYVEKKLRSVIQHHNEVTYIFLGSRRHIIHEMFMDRSSPFYHSSKKLPLSTIEPKAWIPFIRQRFSSGGREISEEMIETICEMTDGHPKYTQHFCEALWGQTEQDTQISENDINIARDKVLMEDSYAYTVIVENLTNNQRRLLVGLAVEGKNVSIWSKEFMNKYRLSGQSSVQKAINSLQKKDLVDKVQDGYIILDRFFKLWLAREYAV